MTKLVLDSNVTNIDSALMPYNNNFQAIENELQNKVLYRDNPVGEPNAMNSPIDMNGQRIYNLPLPTTDTEAARLADVRSFANYPDYFYGFLNSDPLTRPDGTAIQPGDYYFNLTTNTIRYWNSVTFWQNMGEERASQVELSLNTLIAALKSAAYTEASDYATAAQGAKADSAVQSVVAGTSILVDNTDPNNPAVSVDLGDISWLATPIGGYITPLSAPPKDDPRFRYALCTAGQDGPGGYNEGILTGETVSGSDPLVIATATVSLAGSPFDGLTIHHINTEKRFLGAGTAEAFENDSFQGHTFAAIAVPGSYLAYNAGRVGSDAVSGAGTVMYNLTGAYTNRMVISADETNGTPRTSNHTQPKTHRLQFYRRLL